MTELTIVERFAEIAADLEKKLQTRLDQCGELIDIGRHSGHGVWRASWAERF
jgi:hypothetical protein